MNVITLLLDNPSKIIALDIAHPQICLAKLQVACFKYLSYQEMLDFVGIGTDFFSSQLAEKRLTIYEEKLKPFLESDVQLYWDKMKSSIEHGILHCGRREKKLRESAEDYFNIALNQDDIHKLLSKGNNMEQQKSFFRDTIVTDHIRKAYHCLVWKRILARKNYRSQPDVDYASLWFERLTSIIENIPADTNYFLEYLLTGRISGDYSLPEYLCQENFNLLKERIDRIEWVQSDLASWFEKYRGNKTNPLLNRICLSNIPD